MPVSDDSTPEAPVSDDIPDDDSSADATDAEI